MIQLNLIRSVTLILDLLHRELSGAPSPGTQLAMLPGEEDEDPSAVTEFGRPLPRLAFTEYHKLLKLRLVPLRRVQRDLEMRLGSGAEEPVPIAEPTIAAPFDGPTSNSAMTGTATYFTPSSAPSRRPQEFYVRSSTGWKSALERLRPRSSTSSRDSRDAEYFRREREAEETSAIIAGCRDDMYALWTDPVVREMLDRKKMRMEDSGGLYVLMPFALLNLQFESLTASLMMLNVLRRWIMNRATMI